MELSDILKNLADFENNIGENYTLQVLISERGVWNTTLHKVASSITGNRKQFKVGPSLSRSTIFNATFTQNQQSFHWYYK
jgi:hypothetical protein